jgi:hypothetical protein
VACGNNILIDLLLPWGSMATWAPHDAQLWPRMLPGFPFQSLCCVRCAAHGHISKGETTSRMHLLLTRREAKVRRKGERPENMTEVLLGESDYWAAICSMPP